MKNQLILLSVLLILAFKSNAQPLVDADSGSSYLMITNEQQEIYLGRFLQANKEIASQCQPNWSISKSNEYFVAWLNDNPQYLRRNLTSAFSAALMESCKIVKR